MFDINTIQYTVNQLAEATSAAFKIDAIVVDSQKNIITATGAINDKICCEIVKNGLVDKFFFEDMYDKLISTTPGLDIRCADCEKYENCIYRNVVFTSIKVDKQLVGVIGLTATDEKQVSLMKNNEEEIYNFLVKISGLIVSKLTEVHNEKEKAIYSLLLKKTYDNINNGVIIVDNKFNIISSNKFMKKLLAVNEKNIKGIKINQLIPNIALNNNIGNMSNSEYKELTITVKNKNIYLLYVSTSIILDNNIEAVLYFFEDYDTINKLAYNSIYKKNEITLDDIIGEDASIIEFKEKIKKVAPNDSNILLTGETGTGKELFARAIHYESNRKGNNFIAINCGAIPENLIESELFGYIKGSFTGADPKGKNGKFFMANSGSIFLDEVENMPFYLQQKLLRVIERKEIERIGDNDPIAIDIRIIAATNVPLNKLVEEGKFRADLYHRLNVITLVVPPLRNRGNDILVLTKYFLHKFASKFNKNIEGLDENSKMLFLSYDWKGNVRELQNAIEYAVNMETEQRIRSINLPFQIQNNNNILISNDGNLNTLENMEKTLIIEALNKYGWNDKGRKNAAIELGISRSTIYRKIFKHNLKSN